MYVYDIEMYPNFFLVGFYNVVDKTTVHFEISQRKDQTKDLISFLHYHKGCTLIGFNNIFYDYPLLHYFIIMYNKCKSTPALVKRLFAKSNELGRNMKSGKGWRNKIKTPLFKNIDLFLINHFNNKAKMVSLKELEFTMRMQNIQELPYPFDSKLTFKQMDDVIDYWHNDITATRLLYEQCKDMIEFRERMSSIYGVDFTNANDVKIGEEILIDALAKQLGWSKEYIKDLGTARESMAIDDIILPYISFKSEEFNVLIDWWKTKVITQTKGQFSEIPLEDVQPIFEYTNKVTMSRNTKLKKLNIVYKGFQFDFGTGGIHGASGPGVWIADKKKKIKLVDVSSYYPNLAKVNGFAPAQFPVEIFVAVIDILYQQRMKGKSEGDMQTVKSIKLALNGALYGKSNDRFSCLRDALVMMQICLNGQLLLVMLAEQFLDEEIEIIQINTDGIFIYVEEDKEWLVDKICQEWMQLTSLKLDYDEFERMIQKDCNNYLAVFTDGSIKRKGAGFKHDDLALHQNHSSLVIQKAIEWYFLQGRGDVEEFITNHAQENANLYDFFSRAKLSNKNHKLYGILGDKKCKLQKITRYFVANNGMYLFKQMPPLKGKVEVRMEAIEKEYLVMPCNDLSKFTPDEIRQNINYQYYIDKAKQIINQIEG